MFPVSKVINLLAINSRYEVAVGNYAGGADIHGFHIVYGERVILDNLALIPGQKAYASVRAVNRAGLISSEYNYSYMSIFQLKRYMYSS